VLDVRRLRVLQAVVEAGSVTAAAARLNYTPSAVSQHLAALERDAGIALMEKSGRGVRPTPAGLLLAEHAEGILARLSDAEKALLFLRDGQTGRLAIVAFPTAGAALIPVAVGEFRRHRPEVQLDLTVAESDEALDAVRSGRADLGVTVETFASDAVPDDDLVYTHLLDDPFRIVLPRRHRLAARRRIPLVELAEESWIATSSCPGYCQAEALQACTEAGFSPQVTVEADDYPAAQGYVGVGLGVAMVPLLALGAIREEVVVRRIRGVEPVRHIYAVTLPAKVENGPIPMMLEMLGLAAAEQRRRSVA
jgi:DNA-binding transcriptional LysR family regulator